MTPASTPTHTPPTFNPISMWRGTSVASPRRLVNVHPPPLPPPSCPRLPRLPLRPRRPPRPCGSTSHRPLLLLRHADSRHLLPAPPFRSHRHLNLHNAIVTFIVSRVVAVAASACCFTRPRHCPPHAARCSFVRPCSRSHPVADHHPRRAPCPARRGIGRAEQLHPVLLTLTCPSPPAGAAPLL